MPLKSTRQVPIITFTIEELRNASFFKTIKTTKLFSPISNSIFLLQKIIPNLNLHQPIHFKESP